MKKIIAPEWNPNQTYSWNRAQIKAWIEKYGRSAFFNGELYEIKAVDPLVGYYRVSFLKL